MSDVALFLSVVETADLLGVSDDTVYELASRGELPCAEFGRRKMIPRRAIELVLERAMAGFDPDALVLRLAAAADPTGAIGAEGSTGTAGGVDLLRRT